MRWSLLLAADFMKGGSIALWDMHALNGARRGPEFNLVTRVGYVPLLVASSVVVRGGFAAYVCSVVSYAVVP